VREYGIPALAEIPASANLTDVVFRRAEAEPGVVVLRRRTGTGHWQDVTAAEFGAEVTALARGLVAAGIEPGDRVALMSRTRYEWTLIDYATWAAGAVTVPVYETSSAEQVEWILSDSAARAIFAETSAHEKIISSVRDRLPGLEQLWMIGGLDALASGGAQIGDEQLKQRRTVRTAADLASIVYTSGTTGQPKGCQITHGNLLADVRNAVGGLPEIFEAPGCSTLLFLPLAHVFARIIQVGYMESGAVLGHWPDMNTLAGGLREFRPTFLLAVPRVFEKVYDGAQQQASVSKAGARIFSAAAETAIAWSKARDGAAAGRGPGLALRLRHALFDRLVYSRLRAAVGGRMRYAMSGGAALGEQLSYFFRGAGIMALEGYGMTETAGAATMNRPNRSKIGTVGQPLPGVAIRTADDGEIQVKGQSVFRLLAQRRRDPRRAGPRWLAAHGRHRHPGRRGLPAGDRPEEGTDHHRRRHARRPRRARGPDPREPAGQPGRSDRRRPSLRHLPGDTGSRGAAGLEEATWAARRRQPPRPRRRPRADRGDPAGRGRCEQGGVPRGVDPPVPDPPRGPYPGLRPAHPVTEGAQGRGRQGLRRGHRSALQPSWLTAGAVEDTDTAGAGRLGPSPRDVLTIPPPRERGSLAAEEASLRGP